MKTAAFILLTTITVSGQIINTAYNYSTFPPETGVDSYHRSGFTTFGFSSASDLSNSNPASIAFFNKISAGLSFEYNSEINISNIITVHQTRSKPLLLASFGFVYPMSNFNIALAYHQKYNTYLKYEPLEVSTFEKPDGTGEYVRPINDRIVHSPSILCSYTFGNIQQNNSILSVGVQLFYDYAVIKDKAYQVNYKFNEGSFNWKLGLLYSYKREVSVGILYENKIELEGVIETDPEINVERYDPVHEHSGNYFSVEVDDIKMKLKLPGKIGLGLSARAFNNLSLSFAFSAIDWSTVYKGYRTQINLSSAAVYDFSETANISLGFFNSLFYYRNDENYYYGRRMNWNRIFITAGAEIKFDKFAVQIELMDNHLLAVEKFYQTQAKVGFNYTIE